MANRVHSLHLGYHYIDFNPAMSLSPGLCTLSISCFIVCNVLLSFSSKGFGPRSLRNTSQFQGGVFQRVSRNKRKNP